MEKKKLFEKIKEYGYSDKSAYAIVYQGIRKPRYAVMVDLHRRGIVPFDAWLDIRAYLNDAEKSGDSTTTGQKENV